MFSVSSPHRLYQTARPLSVSWLVGFNGERRCDVVCLHSPVISLLACKMWHWFDHRMKPVKAPQSEGDALRRRRGLWCLSAGPSGARSLSPMSPIRTQRWLWKVISWSQVWSWRVTGQMDIGVLVKTNKGICGVCTYSTLYVQGCSAAERGCASRINLY